MFRVFDAWLEKRHQRATYRQLAEMSPSMLSDIGLTADDLEDLRRGRRRADVPHR